MGKKRYKAKYSVDFSTLNLAWSLAIGDSRDDFARDPLRYQDYAAWREERVTYLIEQIQSESYRPARPIDIELPKSRLAVRPGNVLPIDDAAVLQAIVYLIAQSMDGKLSDNVFSYRLSNDWKKRAAKGDSLFAQGNVADIPFFKSKTLNALALEQSWSSAWPEFDLKSKQAVMDLGYTHMTVTDIAAYFEHIDLPTLGQILITESGKKYHKLIGTLMRSLRAWTRRTDTDTPIGRGIPQGNETSSFLGNMYLIPLDKRLDKFCDRTGSVWFRYMDDIRVFTKGFAEARESVLQINEGLRALHLTIQSSKTDILADRDLVDFLLTPHMDRINEAIKGVEGAKGSKEITQHLQGISDIRSCYTRGLPSSLQHLTGKQNRVFRRCLTLHGLDGRPQMRKSALAAIRSLPDPRTLRSSLRYLSTLGYSYHKEIVNEMLDNCNDGVFVFPYQIALVLQSIRDFHPESWQGIASKIRKIGLKKRSHWYVQQSAIESIAHLPYNQIHVNNLVESWSSAGHPWVRRAALLLNCRNKKHLLAKQLDSALNHPDPQVYRAALYFSEVREGALRDSQHAKLGRLDSSDKVFIYNLPIIYLLSSGQDKSYLTKYRKMLSKWEKTRSPVVKWHLAELLRLTAWAV